jgi:hypothetical protein
LPAANARPASPFRQLPPLPRPNINQPWCLSSPRRPNTRTRSLRRPPWPLQWKPRQPWPTCHHRRQPLCRLRFRRLSWLKLPPWSVQLPASRSGFPTRIPFESDLLSRNQCRN